MIEAEVLRSETILLQGKASRTWRRRGVGIEKAMQVDDEIAHLRVVHGALRHRLPGFVGFRVVRIHADEVELVEVGELDIVERFELAAEYEVEQLLAGPARGVCSGHDRSLLSRPVPWPFPFAS